MNDSDRSNLQSILSQGLNELKELEGDSFSLDKVNLSELSKRTGLSRGKLRVLQKQNFVVKEHGNTGRKRTTKISEYSQRIDDFLKKSVTNSSVIYDRLKEAGYKGKLTQVKEYVRAHRDLVPAKRQQVSPQGNRGVRYTTNPGECFQMDWGFVNVENNEVSSYDAACFAMICHHCGDYYTEFFPNAKQENLFIGMVHAFQVMGVPKYVLTDNMMSVVTGRNSEGKPVWNPEYASFMNEVGFSTKLCKPRHPFTKGRVERLIQFIKGNFLQGTVFGNLTDLNYSAISWCNKQNSTYHQCVDCIPNEKHRTDCSLTAQPLKMTTAVKMYLYPERKISFDGFVNYEGRRFGVPFWYTQKSCRVCREGYYLSVYSADLSRKLAVHNVTWSLKDSFCNDQYVKKQPEEHPTAPVTVTITQTQQPDSGLSQEMFGKFDFDREVE